MVSQMILGSKKALRMQNFKCPRYAREWESSDGDINDYGPGLVVNVGM